MFRFPFKKKETIEPMIQVPKHLAIIMDGNGRWAKKRMQPRIMGHKAGMDALQNITKSASKMGVKVLTVYAFSTENWTRPEKEVTFIMNLPVEFYDKYVPDLHANNVKIQMIGEHSRLPEATKKAMENAMQKTKHNTGLILNFALNYGGRDEMTHAVKEIAQAVLNSELHPGDIDEQLIADYLYTNTLPASLRDPDLVIRTSGELRLSNFLPWQTAYSELYFTDVSWPDFDEKALHEAIQEYNRRHRRFGGI
ncbi:MULTISPECIES: isoprenyl transferase [unclassified Streptococcus]|uniref:isoprenyl transferase n=1 Tax=unclassified Streptococcus TaxID=2608887 RepID=UPI001072DA40|nr:MULTISPECIES: isoprenyl transferase [unclassified Streptococcus]MBF0787217.1 isoprenyl transferase [Streptococcus sp. 19428wC2_LYSM12]MCQ9211903.1 isoprenyl transferase [Streptococcus sp. B01]MCQ9213233.1 isoprenyl transferase [Streptococcus sp. O1]TFV05847.1 isoprenyl transferase [Streptococcus sp. LYSM12]